MKIPTILIILFFANLSNQNKKLTILSREMYVKLHDSLVVSNDPVIINFNNNKYFMQSRESFDENGEIKEAAIIGDVGYTTYSKKEIDQYKDFLKNNHLDRYLKVSINDQLIDMNSNTIKIKKMDTNRHEIFYTLGDKEVVYRITYK